MIHTFFSLLLLCNFVTKSGQEVQFELIPSEQISHSDEGQMKELFTESFLQMYRISGAFFDQSDQEIRDYLQSDFDKILHPYMHEPPQKQLLMAKVHDNLVGYALFERLQQDTVYIAELAIAPAYQQQGLGRKMTLFPVENEAHIRKLVLLTEIVNNSARGFYEALGFSPSSYTQEGYSPDRYCAYEKSF